MLKPEPPGCCCELAKAELGPEIRASAARRAASLAYLLDLRVDESVIYASGQGGMVCGGAIRVSLGVWGSLYLYARPNLQNQWGG